MTAQPFPGAKHPTYSVGHGFQPILLSMQTNSVPIITLWSPCNGTAVHWHQVLSVLSVLSDDPLNRVYLV